MGLLATLEAWYDKRDTLSPIGRHECVLVSCGRIETVHPYGGGSVKANTILDDGAFHLLSLSPPGSTLPQLLCLAFNPPAEYVVDTPRVRLASVQSYETANDFAAFLSIVTRRRVFVRSEETGFRRCWEDEPYCRMDPFQALQGSANVDPTHLALLLARLRALPRKEAGAFMSAVRLYHRSVEMLYTQPELSYALLVMALEAISSQTVPKPSREERCAHLDRAIPRWREIAQYLPDDKRTRFIAMLLGNERFLLDRMTRFVKAYLPQTFWSETEDNAKPLFQVSPRLPGYSLFAPSEDAADEPFRLAPYERFGPGQLEEMLRAVYQARSALVHTGERFPDTSVLGLYPVISAHAAAQHTAVRLQGKKSGIPDIPPILTFERLVSRALVSYLSHGESGMSRSGDPADQCST